MNEFLEQFVLESRELVEQATGELLIVEKDHANKARLDSAFRAFHTLKGGAGIMDFAAMARAVHAAENVLSAIRAGTRQISPKVIGDCLSCLDQVVQWLDEIEAKGDLPSAPDAAADALAARFDADDAPLSTPGAAPDDPGTGTSLSDIARKILDEQLLVVAETNPDGRAGRWASAARVAANVMRHGARGDDALHIEQALAASLVAGDSGSLVQAIRRLFEVSQDTIDLSRPEIIARTLRVDTERIDSLVNLTGELTVAKNAIAHIAKLAGESGNDLAPLLKTEYERLDRLIAGLQRSVLSLRVLPLRNVFQRFPRVVREIALGLGKPVNLVTEGEETEADKAIVEMLFEPLLHVVRNAIDHGIESPVDRKAANKPATADVRLRARREGEHVLVEVSDDGRGIDVVRVREVASKRGLVTDDTLATMSEQDIVDLIFAPGFSTATEVTDLSGRGVGMDAVRTAVERVGGRVAAASQPGRGCTIRFTLPFSIMMTRVMTVEAGGQMFGIPLDAVVETVRLPRDRIQAVGTAGAFVLRDRTIPLIGLAQTLGREGAAGISDEAIVVVTAISGQLGALEVDRLGERLEVMLKPTEGLLAGMAGISGTTLLGDGQVLLILDLQELLL